MNSGVISLLRFVRITEEHLDAVTAIEHEAYLDPWTQNMFRQEITNASAHFYVALIDGVVVGYAGFWLVLDEAHISSITIRSEYRGRGLGREELTFLLDTAANLGVREAILEVRVSNYRAQNLYKSMGFQTLYRRPGYYRGNNEDAFVMAKILAPPPPDDDAANP